MRTLAVYLLAFTCSVAVVLPSGWCCLLNSGCCSPVDEPDATPTPAEEPVACCCGRHADPTPEPETPPKRSNTPSPECRCQDHLATVVKEKPSWVEPGLSFASPTQPVAPAPVAVPEPGPSPIFASPPLHVLGCTWRC